MVINLNELVERPLAINCCQIWRELPQGAQEYPGETQQETISIKADRELSQEELKAILAISMPGWQLENSWVKGKLSFLEESLEIYEGEF